MNRELRTKMPSIQQTLNNPISTDVKKTDADSKQKSKSLADKKRRATPHQFKKGEMVLLRQPHVNKFSTTFHHDPLEIISINGSQIIMRSKTGQIYRRHSSHIRKFYPLNPSTSSTGDCDDDEDLEDSSNSTPTHHPPENEPKPLPAPLLPLPTDPPLRRSTRHRKPPDFFQHS